MLGVGLQLDCGWEKNTQELCKKFYARISILLKQVKDGHFVRKSMNIKSYFVSKAVNSLQNTQRKKSLML